MGVNEGPLLDNQAACVTCGAVHERDRMHTCGICESKLCPKITSSDWGECIRDHLDCSFLEFSYSRDKYEPDAVFVVLCGVNGGVQRTLIRIQNPHYDPEQDEDGMRNDYRDEGWFFESGEELDREQKLEVEDWINDLVRDALEKKR